MVAITTLWLPIVLAAVAVFIVSAAMHTVLGYHWNDFRAVPNQNAAVEALRGLNLPHGDYMLPKADNVKQMRTPEYKAMFERGSVFMMNVSAGSMSIGKNLVQWFVYLLVVGFCCAYIAGRELHPGTDYLSVFRARRLYRLHGLRAGAAAGIDLVPAQLAHDRHRHDRRPGVCGADRRHVRVAVAEVSEPCGACQRRALGA